MMRKNRNWFFSRVAVRLVFKNTLCVVRSDKILCSECTQLKVRVARFMRCAHCEPGLIYDIIVLYCSQNYFYVTFTYKRDKKIKLLCVEKRNSHIGSSIVILMCLIAYDHNTHHQYIYIYFFKYYSTVYSC